MGNASVRILVVEDEALIRIATVAALEAAGYSVFEASGADEAISLLEADPEIHVVVTDVHMPGTMDGLRLAHYVRGRWPPIRLLVVSGVPGGLHSPLPDGALFLDKPFGEDRLLHVVGRLVGA